MRARGSALDGGYLPQHKAPVPVPCTGRPSPSGCQVGKPAERPICTPVSAPPRDQRGGQDSSEATWLSGRPEGQHGPGDEEGSFRPWVPSFLVSGLWEQAPRVFPGDAKLGGRWGESRGLGVLGNRGKPSVLTPQGAGSWLHVATGRLMCVRSPRGRRLLVVSALYPYLLGPSSLLQALDSSESSFLGPNLALWNWGPWGGRGAY